MNVSTFPPPSFAAQFAELKREKAMRERVYPHWIATGKIKKQTADYQMAALEAAMATLEALALGKTAPDPLRDELVATLLEAAEQFAAYALSHRLKQTEEADIKAATNEAMERKCRAVLAKVPA